MRVRLSDLERQFSAIVGRTIALLPQSGGAVLIRQRCLVCGEAITKRVADATTGIGIDVVMHAGRERPFAELTAQRPSDVAAERLARDVRIMYDAHRCDLPPITESSHSVEDLELLWPIYERAACMLMDRVVAIREIIAKRSPAP